MNLYRAGAVNPPQEGFIKRFYGMKHAKKILNAIKNGILFLLGYDCKARRDGVDAGLLDLSGQGRDIYGN